MIVITSYVQCAPGCVDTLPAVAVTVALSELGDRASLQCQQFLRPGGLKPPFDDKLSLASAELILVLSRRSSAGKREIQC